jgi:hypothetical protein
MSLRTSATGYSRRFRNVRNMSVLHPISETEADIADRRFVPIADIFTAPLDTKESTDPGDGY